MHTKAFSIAVFKAAQLFAVVFALLMGLALLPQPARAAAPLTEAQMAQVTSLLSSLGADQATISNVGLAMRATSRDELLKAIALTLPRDASASFRPSGTSSVMPVCALRASKERVSAGESVTLTWDSKDATSVGTASGGQSQELSGSAVVTPTETTSYLKRVFSDAGEGYCTVTVYVGNDKTPAGAPALVRASTDFGQVFRLIGSGAAAVIEGYSSLVGSMTAAVVNAVRPASDERPAASAPQQKDFPPASAQAARPGLCLALSRTLGRGATGEDVTRLQEFLQKTGDLKEASTTGYFGPATEAALQRWQAAKGLVASGTPALTGFGAAGPKTRLALAIACQGEGPGPKPGDPASADTPKKDDLSASTTRKDGYERAHPRKAPVVLPIRKGVSSWNPGETVAPSEAGELTSSQVSAILSLLSSFGLGQPGIDSVNSILNGGAASPGSAAGLSLSQKNAILSLLQSFGADDSIVDGVGVALGGS
jgi:peptidoglycan hydrolase-like protein with peptidoglycan-binding domain